MISSPSSVGATDGVSKSVGTSESVSDGVLSAELDMNNNAGSRTRPAAEPSVSAAPAETETLYNRKNQGGKITKCYTSPSLAGSTYQYDLLGIVCQRDDSVYGAILLDQTI